MNIRKPNGEGRGRLLPLALAFFSILAVSYQGVLGSDRRNLFFLLRGEVSGEALPYLALYFLFASFLVRNWERYKKETCLGAHLVSGLLSLFTLLGVSMLRSGSLVPLLSGAGQLFLSLYYFLGTAFFYDVFLSLAYGAMGRWEEQRKGELWEEHSPQEGRDGQRKTGLGAEKKKGKRFGYGLRIWLCWLPFLLFHLPGSVRFDGLKQLDMYFGVLPFTTLHPWVCTYFFGLLMRLGRLVSDNAGVLCITFTCSVLEAFCYGRVCAYLSSWPLGKWGKRVWLVFALFPAFPVYAQSVVKDGPYMAFFALFFTLLADAALKRVWLPSGQRTAGFGFWGSLGFWGKVIVLGLLICLFRRNGVFLVLPALALFAVWEKGRQRLLPLGAAALVFLLFLGVGKAGDALGIERASARALFTIPFQQTARIVRDFPEDISLKEQEAIEGVLPYKKLAGKYREDISDPVKDLYKQEAGGKEILTYLKAYAQILLRHPLTGAEAFLAGSYGYLYPFVHFETKDALDLGISRHPSVDKGFFSISYLAPERLRLLADGYVRLWEKAPVLSFLFNPGCYTWALLFLAGYLLSKRRGKALVFLVPAFLGVAVCLSSPVNGYLRYALPLAAAFPCHLGFALLAGGRGESEEAGTGSRE